MRRRRKRRRREGCVYAHAALMKICRREWRRRRKKDEEEKEEEEGGLSALKKLMDIRWIENLRSSAWKLSLNLKLPVGNFHYLSVTSGI